MSDFFFRAFLVFEKDGRFKSKIATLKKDDLPEGDVLIRVHYSSLNYKDALSATGNRGVTKNYPHVPGIDAAGTVLKSTDQRFSPGDRVLVTGYDLGMNTSGGFGELIRVPADWVVMLPSGLSLKQSMIFGTAGFTAGLSVKRLVGHGIGPESGPVLVTGATGGVGSMALMILSVLGYEVFAVTGKEEKKKDLLRLGATSVLSRSDLLDESGRPLLKGRWAAVIDTVGGRMLSSALKSTKQRAAVTCCGNVSSNRLDTSIFPFILRGVTLYGIDSAMCPYDERRRIWDLLSSRWKHPMLEEIAQEVELEEIGERIDLILKGRLTGRTILRHRI